MFVFIIYPSKIIIVAFPLICFHFFGITGKVGVTTASETQIITPCPEELFLSDSTLALPDLALKWSNLLKRTLYPPCVKFIKASIQTNICGCLNFVEY